MTRVIRLRKMEEDRTLIYETLRAFLGIKPVKRCAQCNGRLQDDPPVGDEGTNWDVPRATCARCRTEQVAGVMSGLKQEIARQLREGEVASRTPIRLRRPKRRVIRLRRKAPDRRVIRLRRRKTEVSR